MSNRSIIVLHCPAGGGHRAAAEATAEAARARGIRVEVLDALSFTPPWFAQAMVGTHLATTARAPGLYGLGYAAFDHRHALTELRSIGDRALGEGLRRAIIAHNPLAVIATHYFPLAVLGPARRRGQLAAPLVAVVTDYAAHAFWAERGVDAFCAAPGDACRDLVRHRVPATSIVPTGIPVRPAFARIPDLVAPKREERIRVLVTSGGFGIGPTAPVLRSFADPACQRRVELVVVCGRGADRLAEARAVAASLGLAAEVVGFEPNMPRRIAEAHVIVGKPGGLTVSEVLAAGRPMIVVGACPGQELENQRWLTKHGAAIAARPGDVGRLVLALAERGQLDSLARVARTLGRPRAADSVIDVALSTVWRSLAAAA